MSERIDLPSDAGLNAELLEEELMTHHHVVEHVLVVSASFIMHAPASIHELKATLIDELPYLGLFLLGLIFPPHAEELHLDVSEALGRIFDEFTNESIDDKLNLSSCLFLITSCVILVDSF